MSVWGPESPRLSSSVTPCAFLKWGLPLSLDLTDSTRRSCQLAALCVPSSAVGLRSHATMENLNVCWGSELGPQFMLEQQAPSPLSSSLVHWFEFLKKKKKKKKSSGLPGWP